LLSRALLEAREALSSGESAKFVTHRELIDELLSRVEVTQPPESVIGDLVRSLAVARDAGADDDRRAALVDVVGIVARQLAPSDEPAADPAIQAVWRELLGAADRLYGAGVVSLGRLPFVSDRLLELLVAEAGLELVDRPDGGARVSGRAGQALATLAFSRKLAQTVGAALGGCVVANQRASYHYDPPGSHVRTHVDARSHELIFHMILEHDLPHDGAPGSALVAHLPGRPGPQRLWLHPGEAVALSGRGTIHSWEQLRDGERRTLIGIGFERRTEVQSRGRRAHVGEHPASELAY
jgi:hypothetical protein